MPLQCPTGLSYFTPTIGLLVVFVKPTHPIFPFYPFEGPLITSMRSPAFNSMPLQSLIVGGAGAGRVEKHKNPILFFNLFYKLYFVFIG